MKPLFLGVVVLALIGTSSDLFVAVHFARQDRMELLISICIGSGIQIALVVAPLLVLFSWVLSLWNPAEPLTLVFTNPVDLSAIAATVLLSFWAGGCSSVSVR